MTNYGTLIYSSLNIGDEIQTLAALQFLPRVDAYIPRERVNSFTPQCPDIKKTKLIMNAWWMWEPNHFPPSDCIDPLLISMHVALKIRKKLFTNKIIKYLQEHGPVGCRDTSTLEFMQSKGIAAYFSGCLTLTLKKNPALKKKDYILAIDLPQNISDEIKNRTKREVINLSALLQPVFSAKERLEVASLMLSFIQQAHCVVSTRLHAVLPALALETPALAFNIDESEGTASRFSGLKELLHHTTNKDFLANKNIYDFDNPPQNSTAYLPLRDALSAKCSAFTGFCSRDSVIPSSETAPLRLMALLKYRYSTVRRLMWWAKVKDMFKVAAMKLWGKNKHDILD